MAGSLSLPGLNLPNLGSLAIAPGGGGPSTASNRINLDTMNPFNLDNSGWNVNIKGSGSQSAQGNSGANARPTAGLLDSLLSGENTPMLLLGGLVVVMLLRR